jgi:hypothetical protein
MTTQVQMTERYQTFHGISKREQPISIQGVYYRIMGVTASQPNVLGNSSFRAEKGTKLANMVSRTVTAMRRGDMKNPADRQYAIPHDWIVEAGRQTLIPDTWEGVGDLIRYYAPTFRRTLWADSDVYVEIWSEAATMIGVLWPVCNELDVYLRPTEGTCSETLAWEASQRINKMNRETFIYNIGDFDYKGLEIWEATQKRLNELVRVPVHFERLGATIEDRDRYIDFARKAKRPKNDNPGALTLVKRHIEKYGELVLEVDAVPTTELRARVRAAIMRHTTQAHIDAVLAAQVEDRQVLAELARRYSS